MITVLIADSGSTKCEWRLLHEGKAKKIFTTGISPYFLNAEQIKSLLQKELVTKIKNIDIDKIFDSVGNLPSEQLYAAYSALKPFKQGVNKYFNLVENIDNDRFVQNFLRIEKWLYDTPSIAGETIRQWINDI